MQAGARRTIYGGRQPLITGGRAHARPPLGTTMCCAAGEWPTGAPVKHPERGNTRCSRSSAHVVSVRSTMVPRCGPTLQDDGPTEIAARWNGCTKPPAADYADRYVTKTHGNPCDVRPSRPDFSPKDARSHRSPRLRQPEIAVLLFWRIVHTLACSLPR